MFIPVGPGPRGIAVDANDNTVYCSAFSRSHSIPDFPEQFDQFDPHSLTVVNLDSIDLSSSDGQPQYQQIGVGYGPCSVAVFDIDRVELDADKLDRAAVSLVEGATSPA